MQDSEEIKNLSLRKYLVKANKDHVAHLTLVLKSILSKNSNYKMEDLENKIVELLNQAEKELSKEEFESLAESIIDYIDQIARRIN